MNITRREALRQCLILTVGAAIIPSCVQEKSKPLVTLKNVDLDGDQQKMVAELTETIIPATDTPGAKDTYTHLFVLKMLDDCTAKEEQEQFVKGLTAFDNIAKKKFDKAFVLCTAPQREELLSNITTDKEVPEDVNAFYKTMKKLTVQGYMTSKYYLSNVRVYKLVPGKFYGCIPVTSLNQKAPSI
jgi:hypothetical protein